MGLFSCAGCSGDMDESHVICSTVLGGVDSGEGGSTDASLVVTATCPGCNQQSMGYVAVNDLTPM